MVAKYYFTFGTAEQYPFQDTYIVVMAKNENDAIATFRRSFPDVTPGIVNCSFIYNECEFMKTNRYRCEPAKILASESVAMYKMLVSAIEEFEKKGYSNAYIANILNSDIYGFDIAKRTFE